MYPLIVVLFFTAGAFAQDRLTLSSASGPAGTTVNLSITLATAAANLTGLQWEMSIPAGVTFVASSGLPGKTLACHGAYCLFVGGQQPIRSGPVAVLAVDVPRGADSPLRMSLRNVQGVLADGSARRIGGSSAWVIPGTAGGLARPRSSTTRTVFGDAIPGKPDTADDKPLELGLRFSSEVSGRVLGIRFYKSAANTGRHVGNLWSSDGKKLASVTFRNETASGWQKATFPRPVPIDVDTVYVVSYLCPKGHYAGDPGFFAQKRERPPLYVPASGGVFAYGETSQFPTSVFNAANYWVDVIFQEE